MTLKRLCIALAVVIATVLLLDWLFPPPLAQFQRARAGGSQVVLAADGTPLRAFADARGVWRYPIAPSAVSPFYLQALLAYEDRWFYRHIGVNPAALLRASSQALLSGRVVSGGSTISMQVARMIEPIPRTALGKLKQIVRALQLEARLSKDELLALYLSHAPFGGTIEGVEAASYAYLGKSSRDLSRAEAALLVVLPQRPSALRPDRYPERARVARDKVLSRLQALGIWDALAVNDARVESVAARRLRVPQDAPLLAQRLVDAHPDQARIYSTINANWQAMAQARVSNTLRRFPPSTSGAALIVDNRSMQARAYVGSGAFGAPESFGHVDMVQAKRSPGSTLKPLLYGLALDAGLIHSESLLIDAPQNFGSYRPGNFAEKFNGPVSAASALRLSLNVPAVDLLDRVGPARFYAALEHAGLRLSLPPGAKPNLSIILGGAATNLEDLVGAYAAIARAGMAGRVQLHSGAKLANRRVLSPGAAWMIFQMLAENARGAGDSAFFDPRGRRRVAWKTGTSFGFRDAWALGSTGGITVGVWIGRPDGTPLPGSFGAVSALPLLFELLDSLPTQAHGDAPVRPSSVSKVDICWPLGTRFEPAEAELCHRKWSAYVLDGTVPPTFAERGVHLWQAGRVEYLHDSNGGARRNASCLHADVQVAQIARWPALSYPWLSARVRALATLPQLHPSCTPDGPRAEPLVIDGISPGSALRPPSNRLAVPIGMRALGTPERVRWLLNDQLLGETLGSASISIALPNPGAHRLVALDESGRFGAVQFEVLR